MDVYYYYSTMDDEIVKWIHYDNKLKEYNEKSKRLREEKEKLSEKIFEHYEVYNKDKSDLPTFNVEPLKTRVGVHKSNHYESLNYKFLTECLREYFDSEEKAKDILVFIRDRRSLETKVTLKRESK